MKEYLDSYKTDYSLCTGCSACYSICPQSAISMVESDEGFLYPKINSKNCVNCSLCIKVCPIHKINKTTNANPIFFAAINKNEIERYQSSSGGIFITIAKQIITDNGVVFGAKFAQDNTVIHSWTDKIDELYQFCGSKYVQSVIGECYKDCKTFLDEGRKVLFTGTPCQIEGLKKYLSEKGKRLNLDNLVMIDFICHGVPAPLLWRKYLSFIKEKINYKYGLIEKISFRNKKNGWKNFSLSFSFQNDFEYSKSLDKDPYLKIFLKDIALRESCYRCPCRGVERESDLTIADFWGIEQFLPELNDDKGTSLVFYNTKQGEKLLSKISEICNFYEIKNKEVRNYNPAIEKSPIRPKERDCFYSDLNKYSLRKIIRKYATESLLLCMLGFVRRICHKLLRILTGENNIQKIKTIFKGEK